MHNLFRPEVEAARQQDWIGRISFRPPAFGWWAVGGASIVATMLAALATFGHYTQHERGVAYLVPSGGIITSIAHVPGTVDDVLVKEGQRVDVGSPLVEISREQSSEKGDSIADALRQLSFKRENLTDDLTQENIIAISTRRELMGRLKLLHAQENQLHAQIRLQQERTDAATRLYIQWNNLGNTGLVSKLQILQQQDTALQNQTSVRDLKRQALALEQERQKAQSDLDQLSATERTHRNEVLRNIADVDRDLSHSAADMMLVIKSPTAGTVTSLFVHPGQSIGQDDQLMTVMPEGSTLSAELWLPSSAMGSVAVGNPVTLRYRAFPYQKYGIHTGEVDSVAQTPTAPELVSKIQGQKVEQPLYRISVRIDHQSVSVDNRNVRLLPGTVADADVILEKRSLLDWLMAPMRTFSAEPRLPDSGREPPHG